MTAELFLLSALNGISYGLLLFMLAAGLTLIFSMMGVLNFAHASFYMLGAYFGYQVSNWVGFWPGLVLAPLITGLLGAMVERHGLRRVHKWGHVPELLLTFGLALIIGELVQVIWGRPPVPYQLPPELEGPLFTIYSSTFPIKRGFIMFVALLMMLVLWWVLKRTRIGLVVQGALTHPDQVEALGHNVRQVFMLVFGGGCALAGLAGAIGGAVLVTDPSMAQFAGALVFVVVVVGGMGSLAGAFVAALLIGCLSSFGTALDYSIANMLGGLGVGITPDTFGYAVWKLTIAQVAPVLPFLLLVLILIVRPRGLMGTREG